MPNKVVTRYSRQCAILYDAVWVFLCFKVLKTSKASVSFQPSFVRTIIAMESSQLARLVLTLQSKTKLRIYLSGVHTKPPVDLAKAIERCVHTKLEMLLNFLLNKTGRAPNVKLARSIPFCQSTFLSS